MGLTAARCVLIVGAIGIAMAGLSRHALINEGAKDVGGVEVTGIPVVLGVEVRPVTGILFLGTVDFLPATSTYLLSQWESSVVKSYDEWAGYWVLYPSLDTMI